MALDAHDKKDLRELFDADYTFSQAIEQMGDMTSEELSEAKKLWHSFIDKENV